MPTWKLIIVLLLFGALLLYVAVRPLDIEFTLLWVYSLSWGLTVIPLTYHTYITYSKK